MRDAFPNGWLFRSGSSCASTSACIRAEVFENWTYYPANGQRNERKNSPFGATLDIERVTCRFSPIPRLFFYNGGKS